MIRGAQVLKSDILVFIDGDGTYSGSELENVVRPIVEGEADLVVGSRLVDESRRERGRSKELILSAIGSSILSIMYQLEESLLTYCLGTGP